MIIYLLYEGPMTELVQIEGRFNSTKLIQILQTHVTPMMNDLKNDESPRIFVQNNSTVHNDVSVMAFLSRQDYRLLDWPPSSSDLNPIETVWSLMENEWPSIQPKNEETLHTLVQERWDALLGNHRRFFIFQNQTKNTPKDAIQHVNVFFFSLVFELVFRIFSNPLPITTHTMPRNHRQ